MAFILFYRKTWLSWKITCVDAIFPIFCVINAEIHFYFNTRRLEQSGYPACYYVYPNTKAFWSNVEEKIIWRINFHVNGRKQIQFWKFCTHSSNYLKHNLFKNVSKGPAFLWQTKIQTTDIKVLTRNLRYMYRKPLHDKNVAITAV